MKKIAMICGMVLFLSVLSACSAKEMSVEEKIAVDKYDWTVAREEYVTSLKSLLSVIVAGDSDSYAKAKVEWSPRVYPKVQSAMFPNVYPPQGCSASIVYLGYSGFEYNSEGTEYVKFIARCLNNTTLASTDFDITIELERGKDGYYIKGFHKEVLEDA